MNNKEFLSNLVKKTSGISLDTETCCIRVSGDDAINFFFRSLFAPVGTDVYKVKIDYPKERLLRLSDGLWQPGASSGTPDAPIGGASLGRPEKD